VCDDSEMAKRVLIVDDHERFVRWRAIFLSAPGHDRRGGGRRGGGPRRGRRHTLWLSPKTVETHIRGTFASSGSASPPRTTAEYWQCSHIYVGKEGNRWGDACADLPRTSTRLDHGRNLKNLDAEWSNRQPVRPWN
jgi:hypothetical protein